MKLLSTFLFLLLFLVGFNTKSQDLDTTLCYTFTTDSTSEVDSTLQGMILYDYDNYNNIIYEDKYHFDTNTNNMVRDSLFEWSYDENNNKTLEAIYHYDTSSQKMIGDHKEKWSYNSSNNLTTDVIYRWDTVNNAWTNYFQCDYIYDSINNLKFKNCYEWDLSDSLWKTYSKMEYFYKADSQVDSIMMYMWNTTDSTWEIYKKAKYSYSYREDTLLETIVWYKWDSTDSVWKHWDKYESEYLNDTLISEDKFYWDYDPNLDEWVGIYKYDYEYDENGNATTKVSYYWDVVLLKWILQLKYNFSYNMNGGLNKIMSYSYDVADDEWYYYEKIEFSYDNNELVLVAYYAYFSYTPENWVIKKKCYHHSRYLFVPDIMSKPVEYVLYPNPANSTVTIRCSKDLTGSTLEILDINGKTVKYTKLNKTQTTIDISHLAKGAYFVKISGKQGVEVRKIVVN